VRNGQRRWLFADQLGDHFLDGPDQPVLLVEARSVLRRRRFHRQKANLVLSALRRRAAEWGDRAVFVPTETYGEYGEALDAIGEPLSVCHPTSRAAAVFVRGRAGLTVLRPRGYATTWEEFSAWAGPAQAGRHRGGVRP
jgi:deoxyribodipyrimidine photolyase-related protein